MIGSQAVHLSVNGEARVLSVPPDRRLLDALRYDLGLTGTKEGCGVGVCGACTVLVDGQMVSACLMFTPAAHGREITTIEGLAGPGGELTDVQQAFLEKGGIQCGICTPGQVLAATALLEEVSNPSEDEVKEWMTGNLCRCTGYYKIIEAIMEAAAKRGGFRAEGRQ